MASSYKYFSDHDRTIINNQLIEIIDNQKGTNWLSSSDSPYYFLQIAQYTLINHNIFYQS